MSGHFETLLYTDCRPGQGLRGSAGLQFQARSSDAVAAAETLVKDHLLYEPPSRWMADRRPAADYPRSFGHLSASGYLATATGLYLGREANGVREGNQLTHAIVTTDPEAYQGLRPAQLYGADFWSAAPAATTRAEPVTVSGVGGPYSPARAKKFVQDQPDGPATLLALVSALERAGKDGAGRVLFLGDDVGDIVEWLVAGTLLLSRARALQLGFKIYSNDPARSSAPVVAVHPDFAGPAARIGNQLGYLVFDLVAHRQSDVEPTPAASRWVKLFVGEDNPRDVVDALDVAGESGITGDDDAAAALGLAAIMHRKPDARYAETIVGWLRWGPQRLRDAYAADLADLFADMPERWSRRVLELLDEVGCEGLLPGKAAEVRIALLLKDIGEAAGGGEVSAVPPAALPAGEWGPDRDEQVRDLLLEALAVPGASGVAVEALLRVAHRYGADLHPGQLGRPTIELVRHLADHSELMRPENWPNGTEVEGPLLDELRARAVRGDPGPAAVGRLWGRWLLRRRDRLSPVLLTAALGAAVRVGDGRDALMRTELTEVANDPDRFAHRVAALFSQASPTLTEMWQIHDRAPDFTPPLTEVFRPLIDTVAGKGLVSTDHLSLCRKLVHRRLLEPGRVLEAVLARDEILGDTLAKLRDDPAEDRIDDLIQELADTDRRLVEPRIDGVVTALLSLPVFRPVDRVLKRHPGVTGPYLDRLAVALRDEDRPALGAVAFVLVAGFLREDKTRRVAVRKALDHWLMWVPEKRITVVTGQISAALSKAWVNAWTDHVEALAGRRKRYRMTHLFGGRS